MYIRRKVFSVILDENGDERSFSTNEFISEEDYLSEIMYSKKRRNKREKLRDLNSDEREVLSRGLKAGKWKRREFELYKDMDQSKDPKIRKRAKREMMLRDAAETGAGGAILGGIAGASLLAANRAIGRKTSGKDFIKTVGGLSALGGTVFGAAGAAGSRLGTAARTKLAKNSKTVREAIRRESDLYDVSQGKMRLDDYKRKYKDEE